MANPVTIRRLGPSGSLKKKNTSLENMRDVTPKVSRWIFLDSKCIFVVTEKISAEALGRSENLLFHDSLFPQPFFEPFQTALRFAFEAFGIGGIVGNRLQFPIDEEK